MTLKRLFDIGFSIFSLLILGPLLILVAILVYLHDFGPIIYQQTRVGLNGKNYRILKFRSMVLNADKLGGYATMADDNRVTKIGRLIRRTSIDELPQLINVLIGDMSIVGPRPDVPAQKVDYTEDEWLTRISVKPGITGLAQATVRSKATEGQRKALDFEYIAHQSLMFDIKIIVMTFKQLIVKGGN